MTSQKSAGIRNSATSSAFLLTVSRVSAPRLRSMAHLPSRVLPAHLFPGFWGISKLLSSVKAVSNPELPRTHMELAAFCSKIQAKSQYSLSVVFLQQLPISLEKMLQERVRIYFFRYWNQGRESTLVQLTLRLKDPSLLLAQSFAGSETTWVLSRHHRTRRLSLPKFQILDPLSLCQPSTVSSPHAGDQMLVARWLASHRYEKRIQRWGHNIIFSVYNKAAYRLRRSRILLLPNQGFIWRDR